MRNIFLCIALIIIAITPAFGSSLDELTSPEQAAILRAAAGPVTGLQQRTPIPRLLPRHTALERLVTEIKGNLNPNMMVEALFLYRKPSATEWNESEQTSLLNQLTALSTLAGVQYYSASRKTMRIFYESSQVIDNPIDKNPLSDPVYRTLPDTVVLYARQKDLTFGDNIYRYDYYTGADALFFVQENVTSMNAGIIPAVGKNKFRTLVAVLDAGDSFLIYTVAMAQTVSIPGMGDRIGASFTNRMNAIFQWFTGRADEVFSGHSK